MIVDRPLPLVILAALFTWVAMSDRRPVRASDDAAQLEPTRRMVYCVTPQGELMLHLFEPSDWRPTDRRSAFVLFHGGGWTGGTPRRMYPFAAHAAQRGMLGVSVEYRLLNPKRGTTVLDAVHDARRTDRFLESLRLLPASSVSSRGR